MAESAIPVEKSKIVVFCGDLSSSTSRGAAPPPKQDDGRNGNKSEDESGNSHGNFPKLMVGKGRCGGRKASECSASYEIVEVISV